MVAGFREEKPHFEALMVFKFITRIISDGHACLC